MTYELEIKKDNNFLYATINGIRTVESIKRATKEICDECIKNQCSKVLIDVRTFKEHINILKIFDLASKNLPEIIKNKINKVAIVDLEIFDNTMFFENVAVNRGHNVRIFTDVFDAKQWLD